MTSQNRGPVKAVTRNIQIVEALRDLREAGVTELADHLQLPKSTVNDHLITLRNHNYVIQINGKYRLSLQFLKIGDQARNNTNIYKPARKPVNDLADRTGELAHLSVEENHEGVIIYEAEGEKSVTLDTYVGRRMTLHNTALGKAILAYMADSTIEEILDEQGMPRETDQTITDRNELFDQLRTVRNQGYAVSTEERLEGLGCISAPIKRSSDLPPYGAISVCAPITRFETQEFMSTIPDLVCQTANVIELELKYS